MTTSPFNPSGRRAFLRACTGLAAATARLRMPGAVQLALPLAGLGAAAQLQAANTGDGYKALVCLFMAGGNDSHNWVVPTDASNYAAYAAARTDLAVAPARLQAITATGQGSGRSFGMPLELAPLRSRYEAGQAAVLANVGTLVRPISKADVAAGRNLPLKLFSHNDQQSTWQSLQPEGAPSGWGGRMGDLLMAANQYPVFTAVSTAGNAVFVSGRQVGGFQLSLDGPVRINAAQPGWHAGSADVPGALRSLLAASPADAFQAEYLKVVQRSLNATSVLESAIAGTGVPALSAATVNLAGGGTLVLANEGLARQLRVVAQMIAAGSQLGMRRQVFMVQLGGFDMHSNLTRDQPLMMARVAQSVDWFMAALQAQGLLNRVVLFTASDFGRAMVSNGDGCDHGWGSHHLIAGGAVKGRQIHGRFPAAALGSADDIGSGRLLPSTSVTELAANLGGWMGLSAAEQLSVLPTLANFSTRLGVV